MDICATPQAVFGASITTSLEVILFSFKFGPLAQQAFVHAKYPEHEILALGHFTCAVNPLNTDENRKLQLSWPSKPQSSSVRRTVSG